MSAVKAVRAVVRGRVQGVGFRFAAHHHAVRLGVTGWVRNLPTGEVAALIQGSDAAVDAMVEWLGTGPRAARVTGVSIDVAEPDPAHRSFDIL